MLARSGLRTYVYAMLAFELRSTPKVFNVVADVLEWCIAKDGEEILYHYLDDFGEHLFLLQVCGQLGVPLAPDKQDGPSTFITYLGILLWTLFSKS